MKLNNSILSVFLLISFTLLQIACSNVAQSEVGQNTRIDKLIQAFQEKDYETVLELSAFTKSEINRIKIRHPKILWESKITEFRSGREGRVRDCLTFARSLESSPSTELRDLLRFSEFDQSPISSIKFMIYFFTPQSEWEIVEKERNAGFIILGRYPDPNTAPLFFSEPLKEVLLTIWIDRDGHWAKCNYIEDGNVFWE